MSPVTQPHRLDEAKVLFDSGYLELGLAALRDHLGQVPDDLRAIALLIDKTARATPDEKIKWVAHAANALNEIEQTGDMLPLTALRVGMLLNYRRELAGARAVCAWMAERYPEHAETGLLLSEVLPAVGAPGGALEALFRAVQAHPRDPRLNLRMAETLASVGRLAEALPYAKALKGHDSGARALLVLARSRIATGDAPVAPRLLLQALAVGARARDVSAILAEMADHGQDALADEVLSAILETQPDEAVVWRARADIRLRREDLDQAIEMLARAVELDPRRADLDLLCELLARQGRLKEAWVTHARMAALYPREIATAVVRAKLVAADGDEDQAAARSRSLAARIAKVAAAPMVPQRISMAGVIGSHGLGDFVYQLLALASLKRHFSDAHLTLIYSNDRVFKEQVLRFCPDLDEVRDYAGGALTTPVATKDWTGLRQSMLFTQSSLSPTLLTRLERTAVLRTPPGDVDRLTGDLVALGLDPDRWFVAMHYRSSAAYSARMVGARDVDPSRFHALAASICQAGGQVVRLGHPGMDAPPPHEGYVDLAHTSTAHQMFAVAKARFMIACDSGPTSFATAFKTPLLKTNAFTDDGAAYAGDLILPKGIVNWRGEVIDFGDALDRRMLFFKDLWAAGRGVGFLDNSLEQLNAAVERMMARTKGTGWRADGPADPRPPPEHLAWPTHMQRRAQVLNLTHLYGLPTVPADLDLVE